MNSFMMGGFSFLLMYVYVVVPLAPIIYIFIKWRSYRDAEPVDPLLGLKVVLYYFKTLGYHVLLVGIIMILSGLMGGEGGDQAKVGLGLLISGAIFYGVHRYLIANKSNSVAFPQTERVYISFNLIITGIAGMISLIILAISLFEIRGSSIALPVSCTIVYMAAWAAQTQLMLKHSEIPTPQSSSQ